MDVPVLANLQELIHISYVQTQDGNLEDQPGMMMIGINEDCQENPCCQYNLKMIDIYIIFFFFFFFFFFFKKFRNRFIMEMEYYLAYSSCQMEFKYVRNEFGVFGLSVIYKMSWILHETDSDGDVPVLEICGESFHCHYSQVHYDLEWKYLLRSHLWVK